MMTRNYIAKVPLTIHVRYLQIGIILLLLFISAGCRLQMTESTEPGTTESKTRDANKLLVVDCLLPGQIRKLGSRMTYLSPRRPTKTSALDCEIRGGEYVAFDRADYRTALNVWLPRAKEGDSEAQNYVGEIYEKGLGIQADFQTAAAWYRKAAEQNNSRAQINLGFLHEKGYGVVKDLSKALNLYRKASGLVDDSLQFSSTIVASAETKRQVIALKNEVAQQKRVSDRLKTQLQNTRSQLQTQKKDLSTAEIKLVNLRKEFDSHSSNTRAELDSAKIEKLSEQLGKQELKVSNQREKIADLENNLNHQTSKLDEQLLAERIKSESLFTDLKTQQEEVVSLNNKLADAQDLLRTNQQLIDRKEPEIKQKQQQLDMVKGELSHANNRITDSETQILGLQKDLKQYKDQLQVQRETESKLKILEASYQTKLNQLSDMSEHQREQQTDAEIRGKEIISLQRKLDATRQQLETTQQQLATTSPKLEIEQQRLSETQNQLITAKLEVTDKRKRLQQLHITLKQREAEILQQRKNNTSLKTRTEGYKVMLAKLETEQRQLALEGPTIEILDPPIALTRGLPSIRLRSAAKERLIVGKVSAPAGLISFTVNDNSEKTDQAGIFSVTIPVERDQVPVKMVAVDKAGKQASIEFLIIPQMRNIARQSAKATAPDPSFTKILAAEVDFGTYHALIIGNNSYKYFPGLDTAITDARETEKVLREKYGFKTRLLIDANRYEILSVLNEMRDELTESDNLLIYYAGHGELDRANTRGHWLPVDAERDNSANWISNIAITDILNAMQAKHILVVADSCYSGSMTLSSVPRLESEPGEIDKKNKLRWLKVMAKVRSRTVLTSGGLQPVLDQGGGNHSVFANAFLTTLKNNDGVLEAYKLYRNLFTEVRQSAGKFGIDQRPEYTAIKHGGHEAGEFIFVPVI